MSQWSVVADASMWREPLKGDAAVLTKCLDLSPGARQAADVLAKDFPRQRISCSRWLSCRRQ